MKNIHVTRHILSTIFGVASFVLLISVSHADGLKSQWKTRMPQPAGLVNVETKQWLPYFPEKKHAPMQTEAKAVPRLTVQRRERLQDRILKKEGVNEVRTQTSPQQTPTFGVTEKIRSIHRMTKPANHCAVLHTHERAQCLRDLTYERTNQFHAHVAGSIARAFVAFVR